MLQGEHIMGWRIIIIEQSQQVSLHLDNLKIRMLEGVVTECGFTAFCYSPLFVLSCNSYELEL